MTSRPIKAAVSELEQASHALSSSLYDTPQGDAPAGAAPGAASSTGDAAADDDTIDAEFEVKDS